MIGKAVIWVNSMNESDGMKQNKIGISIHNTGIRFGKVIEYFLFGILFLVILYITQLQLKFLRTEILVKDIVYNGIDYDAFRDVRISAKSILQAERQIEHVVTKYPKLKDIPFIDAIGLITFSMMGRDYDLLEHKVADNKTFLRAIGKIALTDSFQELYECYLAILSDIKYFPVPRIKNEPEDVSFSNTWYVLRKYGGNRRHEGTDLMASKNQRGYFPIVSITDGVVEKIGWLEQGGYRIGIRSDSGAYFYYAHLHSYAPEIKTGDKVIAGQLIGFMGDSGYGEEGTIGKFDVHLHLGIYVNSKIGELSINPYYILKLIENKRITYDYYKSSFKNMRGYGIITGIIAPI